MFLELASGEFDRARSLLQPLDHHLAVPATLCGAVPGRVYLESSSPPRAACVWTRRRLHLAGDPDPAAWLPAWNDLLAREIMPRARAEGTDFLLLYYTPFGLAEALVDALTRYDPRSGLRHYYARQPAPAVHPLLPPGMELRPVDAALLAEGELEHRAELVEEMLSERTSVQEFLARSFGFCVVHDRTQLAGWCLSEYNTGERCEVGVETLPEYQRRGLGTAATAALVDRAWHSGLAEVGWHCWAGNSPSVALALRAGFHLVLEYPCFVLSVPAASAV